MASTNDNIDKISDLQRLPTLQQELESLSIPEEIRQTVIQVAMRSHAGPLPPSDTFREYGEVEPTAPQTILDMATRQQHHDHWMDKATLISETTYRITGVIAAVGILGGMLYAAVICALAGYPAVAIALSITSGLSAVGGIFVRGRDMARMGAGNPEANKAPASVPSQQKRKSGRR